MNGNSNKRSGQSEKLYRTLIERKYPENIALSIANELNTDFTAGQMLGYLSHIRKPPLEELADEMLSILALRDRIRSKKKMEYYQSKVNASYDFWYDMNRNENKD